jgi:signal transduction histidine kinase
LILKSYKNKKIEELTDLIKEINNKNYVLDMKDNVEDDTSILKSELYKTTIMLKESAENSLKDKLSIKEFIEDTSHQLKTPLASISIILDNLIDNPNMDNKLRESFLKDINREISKINNLVNTMLKLSMFEVNVLSLIENIIV